MTDSPNDATSTGELVDAEAALAPDVPGRDAGLVDENDTRATERIKASPETVAEYEDLERGTDLRGEGRVP